MAIVETGEEYAKLTIGNKEYAVRGTDKGVDIPAELMEKLRSEGGILDFHCHPYIGDTVPSEEDVQAIIKIKSITGQETSEIISPDGKVATFGTSGIISVETLQEAMITEERKQAFAKMFEGK